MMGIDHSVRSAAATNNTINSNPVTMGTTIWRSNSSRFILRMATHRTSQQAELLPAEVRYLGNKTRESWSDDTGRTVVSSPTLN